MKTTEWLQSKYNSLCTELGDKHYKLKALSDAIGVLESQIKELNRVAPELQSMDKVQQETLARAEAKVALAETTVTVETAPTSNVTELADQNE